MPRAELASRLRERRDTARERLAVMRGITFGAPRLADDPRLADARARLGRGEMDPAGRSMARHFARRQPRFPVAPAQRRTIVQEIHASFPGAAAHARQRADRIRGGSYDLLGYTGLRFNSSPGEIDWHLDPVSGHRAPGGFWTTVPYLAAESGDHKVIWELNRHQHWLALGRAHVLSGSAVYRDAFTSELRSWLAANPPYRGANWASMLELAFRSLSWIWALHLFADDEEMPDAAWILELLGGLELQLDHIARHLSWFFSPNTHLLGEGLALYVAGQALPELERSSAWAGLGRQVLLRERHAQVHADGGHAEQSLHYHRYALDFYLLALAVARVTGDPAATEFDETARRMARFARSLADSTGRLMTIGDDDGGMLFPMCGGAPWDVSPTLAVASALLDDPSLVIGPAREEAIWMAGRSNAEALPGSAEPVRSVFFPNTGYAVLSDERSHVIFDAGPHGFLNGGHAHADALAVVASIDGVPLLIDPGTATYTMDPGMRDRFRSTAMHNTVMIGGRDQSTPRGPFHWTTRTDARLTRWITAPDADFAEGEHDAYAPVRHRRAVLRAPNLLLVADHLLGEDDCRFTVHWHVDPAWQVTDAGRWVDLAHQRGTASIGVSTGPLSPIRGEAGGVGWTAPVYGQLLPSPTLRHGHAGPLPLTAITVMVFGERRALRDLQSLELEGAERGAAAAVSIVDALGTSIALCAGPTQPGPRPPLLVRTGAGHLSTDARAAVLQVSPSGAPESLLLVEATQVSWSGAGAFAVGDLVAELLQLDSSVLRQLSRTDEPRW